MKYLPLIVATAIGITATPAKADELSYALAYESSVKSPLNAKAYPASWMPAYDVLVQRLNTDRSNVMDYVGATKVDMCRLGKEAGIKKYMTIWKDFHANRPKTASNKLAERADYFMLLEIYRIPCDP